MMQKPLEEKGKEKVLLSFLERTKEGTYAQIEESSLPYSRITEESPAIELTEEFYYYSIT
ncbi:hypothetical protein ES705_43084 [subsurface metagenome]|jgi:hypothetical protein|nr:hypothetical protein [Clostridia bacterium]